MYLGQNSQNPLTSALTAASKPLAPVVKPIAKPVGKVFGFIKDNRVVLFGLVGLCAWWLWHKERVDSYLKKTFVDYETGEEFHLTDKQFKKLEKYYWIIKKYYTADQMDDMILKKAKKLYQER